MADEKQFLDIPGLTHLWSKLKTKLSEAKKAGTDAQTNLTNHNTDTQSHNDLRLEFKALSERINAALDSDDTTMDQLSEIVAYIKSNKGLIDGITTNKVNVSDIVNDLLTNVANKPLSAAQGVALKKLIDDKADAETENGGFNGGYGASTTVGGAIGKNAKSTYGGAVGSGADTGYGGAVGQNSESLSGGAVGQQALAYHGGAIGNSAKAGNGFAGGQNAKAIDSSGEGIDAIQLGSGTNNTQKTLQVYGYRLMNADGSIPPERLGYVSTAIEEAIGDVIGGSY